MVILASGSQLFEFILTVIAVVDVVVLVGIVTCFQFTGGVRP